jgi:hypothetical protein
MTSKTIPWSHALKTEIFPKLFLVSAFVTWHSANCFSQVACDLTLSESALGEGNGGPGSAGVVLPPVHPSESAHQITAASDITRENYASVENRVGYRQ